MKRKIALALAAVMTVAMLPMSAMAASSNSLSQSNTSIKDDEILIRGLDYRDIDLLTSASPIVDIADGTPVKLQIRPTSQVEVGSSIILTVENGKFDRRLLSNDAFKYEKKGYSAEELFADAAVGTNPDDPFESYVTAITNASLHTGNKEMPYTYTWINSEQIEVTLWPISSTDANSSNSKISDGAPEYQIALPITTEDSDEGAVTVTIDANDSSISSGSYTVATVTDSDGSTTASVVSSDITVTSNESYEVPSITIKEDIAGTFKPGEKIKLRLNGSYEWSKNWVTVDDNGNEITAGVVAGVNCKVPGDTVIVDRNDIDIDGRTLEFTIPDSFNSSRTSSMIIKGAVAVTDDDDVYGDINVTISGGTGITTQTIKVGERQDYGFALTALEEPTTIFAGRAPLLEDAEIEEFETAEFEFGETTPDTWLSGRKLEFSVPEGVKIVGYEITDSENMSSQALNILEETGANIVDDGQTLRFDSMGSAFGDRKDAMSFAMKLYLSASVAFSGDVTVNVSGAGLDAGTLSDLVVANVVTPVTVEAATTRSNIGYKAVDTSDITIVENAAGALQEDRDVVITLDDTYSADLAFDDTNTDVTVDGEVEVKNFKVRNGAIYFTVDEESYSAPSTITISGVSVGTTRSIPYGSYSITVGGEAVVDNYMEDVDQDSTIPVTSGEPERMAEVTVVNGKEVTNYIDDFMMFEDEGFDFDNYLEIITDNVTLDGEVRVTIGENSLVMDGETIEMDAAAYIQTASNSTMVPLRFVTLALGVDQEAVTDADNSSKIAWDAATKTATIIYAAGSQQKIIQFTAGSPNMIVDGVSITMENGVVSEIVDGRMYVPFRALGQALGVPVTWDAETRTAIYNEK